MTKYRFLLLSALLLSVTSVSVLAEIYKWKDKDGVMRYTDTPPPSGTKSYQTLGKKASKPVQGGDEDTKAMSGIPARVEGASEADIAEKRRQLAETEKRNKEVKDKERKQREHNCAVAKSNYETYSQGGRMFKTNPQGEREYLGDEDLKAGLEQAQREINENCN